MGIREKLMSIGSPGKTLTYLHKKQMPFYKNLKKALIRASSPLVLAFTKPFIVPSQGFTDARKSLFMSPATAKKRFLRGLIRPLKAL